MSAIIFGKTKRTEYPGTSVETGVPGLFFYGRGARDQR